jgi:hypothetical protein
MLKKQNSNKKSLTTESKACDPAGGCRSLRRWKRIKWLVSSAGSKTIPTANESRLNISVMGVKFTRCEDFLN